MFLIFPKHFSFVFTSIQTCDIGNNKKYRLKMSHSKLKRVSDSVCFTACQVYAYFILKYLINNVLFVRSLSQLYVLYFLKIRYL